MNDDGLNDERKIDRGLAVDLAALRGALREVRPADTDERELLVALRARATAAVVPAEQGAERAPLMRIWRAPVALAALLALAAVTALLTLRVDRGAGAPPAVAGAVPTASAAAIDPAATTTATTATAPTASAAAAPRADFAGAFQPLAFAPVLSPVQSYSVVRVRIPLTALTPGRAAPADATIEADLLVGEDGLASGIRFNKADTLFVSTVSSERGERR